MKPRPIHSRSDLLNLVEPLAPSRACQRAIREDRAEVLGGFTPAEGLPYWLVRITSQFKKQWLIALLCDEQRNRFIVAHPTDVRWADWDGRPDGRTLHDGDNPETYALLRERTRNGRTAEEAQAG